MTIIALQAAVSAAKAEQTRIDIISGNIANLNTVGYKKLDIQTSDLFYMNLKKAGILENSEASKRPVGIQVGLGTKIMGTYRNLAQGPLKQTSQPLDVAITGSGYFAISLPGGKTGYTRAGSFKRDATTGSLVTIDGKPLLDGITIPNNIQTQTITISRDGAITAPDPQNPSTNIAIGQLKLYTFANEHGLEAGGDNILINTEASGDAIEVDSLTDRFQQGWLEGSNVTAVEELTELITAQRGFETASRVMKVVDEISKDTNNIK